jgi:hypothetical protein
LFPFKQSLSINERITRWNYEAMGKLGKEMNIALSPSHIHIVVSSQDLRGSDESMMTIDGRSESVRDVQFSSTNPNEWTAGFENGVIQVDL